MDLTWAYDYAAGVLAEIVMGHDAGIGALIEKRTARWEDR
jgi:hypothetical protein